MFYSPLPLYVDNYLDGCRRLLAFSNREKERLHRSFLHCRLFVFNLLGSYEKEGKLDTKMLHGRWFQHMGFSYSALFMSMSLSVAAGLTLYLLSFLKIFSIIKVPLFTFPYPLKFLYQTEYR